MSSNIGTIRLVFHENFISLSFSELLLDSYDVLIFAFILTDEQITFYITFRTYSVAEAHLEVIYTFHDIIVVTTCDTVGSTIEYNEIVSYLRYNIILIIIIPFVLVHQEQLRFDEEVIPTSHYTNSSRTVFTEEEVVRPFGFTSVLTDTEPGNNGISIDVEE